MKPCINMSCPGIAVRSLQSLKHLLGFNCHDNYNESRVSIKNDVMQPDNAASVLIHVLQRDILRSEYQSFGIKSNQMDFFRKILKSFFKQCSV